MCSSLEDELGMLFGRSYFFIIIDKTISKSPSKLMFGATVSAAVVISRASSSGSGHKWGRGKSQTVGHKKG